MCMHGPLIKIYFGMMNGYHKISFSSEILTTSMWVCRLNWMEMGMDWIGSTIYMSSGWVVLKLLHLRMSLPAVLLCSDEVYPTLVRWLCLWISFDLKPNKRKRSKENQSMYEFDFDLCFYFFHFNDLCLNDCISFGSLSVRLWGSLRRWGFHFHCN